MLDSSNQIDIIKLDDKRSLSSKEAGALDRYRPPSLVSLAARTLINPPVEGISLTTNSFFFLLRIVD